MRTIASALLLLALAGCGCFSNDEAIAFAKGLSQERLAQLHDQMSALRQRRDSYGMLHYDAESGIPAPFKDIPAREIVIGDGFNRIHLSGCFDDKVVLKFDGLDGTAPAKIVLLPGEAESEIVLWRAK